jgi:hypothetical protein
MTARDYPPNRCSIHSDVFLLDTVEHDGSVSRLCPRCVQLIEANVVRGLYERKKASA